MLLRVNYFLAVLFVAFAALAIVLRRPTALPGGAGGH